MHLALSLSGLLISLLIDSYHTRPSFITFFSHDHCLLSNWTLEVDIAESDQMAEEYFGTVWQRGDP